MNDTITKYVLFHNRDRSTYYCSNNVVLEKTDFPYEGQFIKAFPDELRIRYQEAAVYQWTSERVLVDSRALAIVNAHKIISFPVLQEFYKKQMEL